MIDTTFEGDLKLNQTLDGYEVAFEDGLFLSDKTFANAVRISLFGGNEEDSGKVKNRVGWWGNYVDCGDSDRKVVSRFQYATNGTPLTFTKLKEAIAEAKEDLQWLIDSGACDDIQLSASITSSKRIDLKVEIIIDGNTVESSTFAVNWNEVANGV